MLLFPLTEDLSHESIFEHDLILCMPVCVSLTKSVNINRLYSPWGYLKGYE